MNNYDNVGGPTCQKCHGTLEVLVNEAAPWAASSFALCPDCHPAAKKKAWGELPELPELGMRELNPYLGIDGDPYNGATHLQWFSPDQMRAYGELCRAAPAGGDVQGTCSRRCSETMACDNSCAPISAPAGSGEVEDWMVELFDEVYEREWNRAADEADDRHKAIIGPADRHATREAIAALIRKLQQGADYVMVPRDSAKMVTHVCSEWIDLFRAAPGIEKYERYSYEPAVEELRDEYADIAASQGQEGGKP